MTGAVIPDDWDGVTFRCYRVRWPSSDLWTAILLGQMTVPATLNYWDQNTGIPQDAADATQEAYEQTIQDIWSIECSEEVGGEMIGSIKFWPLQGDPTNWHKCDGSLLDTATFPDLFALIGYNYGGAGASFALPNSAVRFPLHTANIGGFFEVGNTGGEIDHVLTEAEMPSHDHEIPGALVAATGTSQRQLSTLAFNSDPVQSAETGGDEGHNNMPPYLVLNMIIKILPDAP